MSGQVRAKMVIVNAIMAAELTRPLSLHESKALAEAIVYTLNANGFEVSETRTK